jgi:hypothetical protein
MLVCGEVTSPQYGSVAHGVLWALTQRVDAREYSKVPVTHAARMLSLELAEVETALETLVDLELIQKQQDGEHLIRCLCEHPTSGLPAT